MVWTGAWPSQNLTLSRRKLTELRQTANSLDNQVDDQVIKAMANFLIIRSTGHIEFTVDTCIHSFALAKSHRDIAQYVESGLFRGRNPSAGKLVEHLGRMSSSWGTDLSHHLSDDDEKIKRELDFLVSRRNLIAHGKNENVGMLKSLQLCDVALEIGDWIVQTIDPR